MNEDLQAKNVVEEFFTVPEVAKILNNAVRQWFKDFPESSTAVHPRDRTIGFTAPCGYRDRRSNYLSNSTRLGRESTRQSVCGAAGEQFRCTGGRRHLFFAAGPPSPPCPLDVAIRLGKADRGTGELLVTAVPRVEQSSIEWLEPIGVLSESSAAGGTLRPIFLPYSAYS